MRYGVFYSPAAQREIIKLPQRRDRRRVLDAIDKLARDSRPPGARKLTNSRLWRARVGDHRVIYSIDDDDAVVIVLRVAHRAKVYDVDLAELQTRAAKAIRRRLLVTDLVPPVGASRRDMSGVIEEIKTFRAAHSLGPDLTIRQLIDEGRER